MLSHGIATRKYARLHLDKYTHSNRVCDEIAKSITQNKPSMVYIGDANLNPNRPIGIKTNKRCSGTRKLIKSIKKLGHSMVVLINEYYTSPTCSNYFGRFSRQTRQHRVKVCRHCEGNNNNTPMKIITRKSKQCLQEECKQMRWMLLNTQVNFANPEIFVGPIKIVKRFRLAQHQLVSKVSIFHKNWRLTD